jgi:ATP-dependent helicase/nuclease subunit A
MILSPASAAQQRAAKREHSVWVAASAGTGKTKVLTDRVLNLLLGGTTPSRILCLTFTKAAAAEMANRLNERLSRWAIIPDSKLAEEIEAITGALPDEPLRALARRLFAEVLDAPGGMRILTIHAFCQSLLRRFPLEAGIPPQFEVMDDRAAAEMLAEAQAAILNQIRDQPTSALAGALERMTYYANEDQFAKLMRALTSERGRLAALVDNAGSLDAYLARLKRTLKLAPDDTVLSCREALTYSRLDETGLTRAAAELLASSKVTDRDRGEGIAAWLALPLVDRLAKFDVYWPVFLTQQQEPHKSLATKAVLENDPDLLDILLMEQARLVAGLERISAAIIFEASASLTRLAASFLDVYATEKRRRSLLDYDDLILTARALLHRAGIAPWVLFKLDGGLDHILIDEAQDTNPDQWQIVQALTQEFFAGEGARPEIRTIFAVGDAKQSIFSFQRADPAQFEAMQGHFAERLAAAKLKFDSVPLQVSFRSTEAVLRLVDAVFESPEARDGVGPDLVPIRHIAHRAGHAGRVEFWWPLQPDAAVQSEPWLPPIEQRSETEPSTRLARMIAETVASWIRHKEILPARGRAIRAGDVLVLVRRRGPFVTELVRELKRAAVPVAGTDRMVLTQQIAVMDLIALGRFLLLPDDDLTLATVLRSPLIGMSDDELFAIAHGRGPISLWQALRSHSAPWAEAAATSLSDLLARADYVPPHELYAAVLGAGGARHKLVQRLGREAEDAIDEFLAQSLAFERSHVPSLQGFLHWLESGEAEIKRDLDQGGRDEVRIMTVHGAKGLQAPIVFLPDTVSVPTQAPLLLWPEIGNIMLWAPSAAGNEPVSSAAKSDALKKRDQEYRRLLYVALTRAEDRLYVCGWQTKRSPSAGSWYELVRTAIGTLTDKQTVSITVPPDQTAIQIKALIYQTPQTIAPKPESRDVARDIEADMMPDFISRPAPSEPSPPRPLIASRPSLEEPAPAAPLGDAARDRRRFQRGLLIHRLMQTLPDLPPDAAEAAARRYLARASHDLEPELQDQIARETLVVLRDPRFGALFGPDSRAEVPIVGLVDGRALSARVDRLVVSADAVWVVDYKTNRPPPQDAAGVAPAYIAQLAAYRAALHQIYPGRRIRTLLLWTDGPRLMEIAAQP